jgi:hypothetical protein
MSYLNCRGAGTALDIYRYGLYEIYPHGDGGKGCDGLVQILITDEKEDAARNWVSAGKCNEN